tara:strand:+ start:854 stop:1348 length:495 start_codon:yes stop_codon:yes gene_type:complete
MQRKEKVLGIINETPGIRFNEIIRVSKIKNGTLSHYVKRLEEDKEIRIERSPRVTRLYPVGIPKEEAKICRYLSIPTQQKIILLILEKETVTSIMVRDHIKKSPSVVSVNLNELFKAKIINRKYDIPSNKFSLNNPEMIRGVINEYYTSLIDKLSENTVEMLDI